MRWLAIKLIHVYRYLLSPWIGNQCRFYPTCSHYAEEAINTHGVLKGGYLTLRRLLKCHPWHPGGIDLVPDATYSTRCQHPEHTCDKPAGEQDAHNQAPDSTHSPHTNGSK